MRSTGPVEWPRSLLRLPMVWALADQAVTSLGNFGVSLVLARTLAPSEFGLFSLVLGAAWYANNVYAALVLYPLSVQGAAADRAVLRDLTAQALAIGGLVLIPLAILIGAAAALAGRADVAFPAACAVILWQVQDTLRRGLQTHLRYREALLGDALSYLGQTLAVVGLALSGLLSANAAFWMIAVTSALAAMLQARQLSLRSASARGLKQAALRSWRLGRWPALSFLVDGTSYQVIPWTLAISAGTASVAAYQAATYLVTLTNPLIIGTATLLLPATASAHQEHGAQAALGVGNRIIFRTGALLFVYLAALAIWPDVGLRVLYGSESPYVDLTGVVRLMTLMWGINYFPALFLTILAAMKRNQFAFRVTLAGALALIVLGVPLTLGMGVNGAVMAVIISNMVKLGMSVVSARRLDSQAPVRRRATTSISRL